MIDKDPTTTQIQSPKKDTLKALLHVAASTGGANVTRNPDHAFSPEYNAIEEARRRAVQDTDLPVMPQTSIDEL